MKKNWLIIFCLLLFTGLFLSLPKLTLAVTCGSLNGSCTPFSANHSQACGSRSSQVTDDCKDDKSCCYTPAPTPTPSPTPAGGGTISGTTVDLSEVNPLGVSGISGINTVIGRVINAVLGITGSVALFMFVYGGFMLMTAAGQDPKIQAGKKIITWAIIGILVILGSYVIVNFIFTGLTAGGGGGGTSGGNNNCASPNVCKPAYECLTGATGGDCSGGDVCCPPN
ncbi:MAG: pilin [Candidatus Parcubacteria bacterium]|nr:pilin [Candidatus Parcubacteria bacterium]